MGGAIFNQSGTVTISNSSFGSNTATGGTGANNGQGLGGAVFTRNGNVTVLNSTFSENTAAEGGGAVFAVSDSNSGTGFTGGNVTLALKNSILANTAGGASDFAAATVGTGSNSFSGRGNLIESNEANAFTGTIASTADPKLGSLADNGGPTNTFALLAGSPAIDSGDSLFGATAGDFDQRGNGFDRRVKTTAGFAAIDIGAFEFKAAPVVADFEVGTLDDEDDGQTTQDADLSLREAIRLANANVNASKITFASSLFSSADQEIVLSLYDTGLDTTEFGATAFIISTDIDIVGPTGNNGLTIERASDNTNKFRLFHVQAAGNLTLDSLTLSGGSAKGGDGNQGGGAAGMGGAIFNQGTLSLLNSTLSGNEAVGGKGGGGAGGFGGGGVGANSQGFDGGGPNGGINDLSTGFNGGFGGGGGSGSGGFGGDGGFGGGGGRSDESDGGIGGFGGGAGLNFGGGGAGMGGAIFNESGTVTITNSSLGSNTATGGTGENNGQGLGGAVFTRNGNVTILNSTFSENTANEAGGAIFALSDNSSGSGFTGGKVTMDVSNTILANSHTSANESSNTNADITVKTLGTGAVGVFTATNNLIEVIEFYDGSGTAFVAANVSTDDINLGALADNGGPTQTFALQAGSPAIDAGDSVAGTAAGDFDQRGSGFDRVIGESIDIGAFELQVTPPDTFVITTLDDEDDGQTTLDGDLSLREALRLANADSNASTITFASGLTSSGAAQITLGGAELLISTNVTITGPGAELLAIDGDAKSRLLEITGGTAELSGLTIRNGRENSGNGGGILLTGGELTLLNSKVSGNTASGFGGSFYINSGTTVTIRSSTISGNSSIGKGGGIYSYGVLAISDSTISGNTSDSSGGGIVSGAGTLTMTNTTVSGNTSNGTGYAVGGGGLFINGSNATITNSTISDNMAPVAGGIANIGGTVTLTNSTITDNRAALGAGGIGTNGGTVTLANTIVAKNYSGSGTTTADDIFGDVTANYSFIGVTTNATITGDNNLNGDPKLGPLADNGGPTKTHKLLSFSPAIDAGSLDLVPADTFDLDGDEDTTEKLPFDQRGVGFPRDVDFDAISGTPDMGAYEAVPTPPDTFVITTLDDEDDADTSDLSDLSLREALRLANADSNASTVTFASSLTSGGSAEIVLGGTALTISSNVTITGPGARLLAISGNNASRVFNVDDGNGSTNATVAISGLSITDGAGTDGGAIFNTETLTVTASSIQDNESTGDGAGVFNDITGILTVRDSTIRNNNAAGSGGGIGNFKGQLTVLNSTLSGNTASLSGGGLLEFYGTVTLKSVTITGNSATSGSGGGLFIAADGVLMHNTIVAGNTAANDGNDILDQLGSANGGLSASSSHNLIGDPVGFDALTDGVNGNIIGNGGNVIDVATILNTTIANNGGPTDTHALTAFSRAIDAGDSVSGAAAGDFDQRGEGFDRVEYGVIDIGAFEFLATPTLTATIDGSGNLTVTDSDEEGIDHRLTVSSFNNGEEFLRINGGNESFDDSILTALPGAELSNRNSTLTIALSLLTGTSITIDAGLGDDRITFDDTHIDDFNITATAESITVQTVTSDTLRAKSVTLNADEVRILANIIADSGNGTVTIQPQTDGSLINLGGADVVGGEGAPNTLGLTDTELDFVSAGKLVIGNSSSGAITVSSDIDLTDEPSVATLHLNTAAGVTSTDGGLKVGGLAINADGAVTLNDADTAVSTVAITTSGAITINQAGALTVSTVGSQSGINNSSGTGNVSLTSSAAGITVANGGLKSSGNVTISAAGNVSTSGFGISNTTGTGTVSVTTTSGTLTSGGSGIQSKGAVTLSAPGLVTVQDAGLSNSSGSGDVSITSSAAGVTVASSGVQSAGNVTINAAGNVSLQSGNVDNTAGTGTVSVITTSGTLTSESSGIQSKGAVTLSAPGLVSVLSGGINNSTGSGDVSITSTGAGVTTTSSGVQSAGNVTLSAAGNMTLAAINNSTGTGKVEITTSSGTITTNSGTITSKGNVSFNAPGLITIGSGGVNVTSSSTQPTVTVTSTAAGITVTSGGIQGMGDVSLSAAGDILVAISGIVNTSGTGKIDVVTSSGAVTIESTGLQSNGNVTVQGTGLISVKNSGIGVTGSTSATVSVTSSAGGIAVSGSGIQGKGDITVSAAGDITSTNGGIGNSTGSGKISITTTAGGISATDGGIQSTGDISLSAAGNVSIINGGASNTSGTGKIDVATSVGTVTISGSGLQSKGNITVSAPGAIDISQGGVSVGSSTAATISISSTGASGSITNGSGGNITGKGNVTLTANQMQLGGTVSASSGTVTVKPSANGTAIDLGTETSGKFSLTDAELDFITSSTVIIGDSNSGAITISAPLNQPKINTLSLIGNTTFAANSGYTFQIGGTTAGTQHDQIQMTGTVTIDSTATLTTVVANSFVVGATDTFAVLLNDNEDEIDGTFSGLPNNGSIADFLGSGTPGAIRYDAGTGNDIVIAKNQPPVVTEEIDDQEPNEDAEFSLSVGENFSDPDVNDTLTFTATKANGDPLPTWLSFNDETQRFTGIPTNDDVGSFDVKVTATDPKNASVSDTFTITVINTNDLPTITADNDGVVATGGSATNTGTWDDVDVGDTVTLTASVGNVVKNDDGTWSWSGTLTASTTVTITATDEAETTDTVTFRVGVPGTKVTGANGVIGVDDAANDGSPTNDNLRVYIENGKVYVQDLTNGIIAVSGSRQIDPFTVELDDFNRLTFNGTSGDDKLTLDFSNGNPIPAGGMVFNGGAGFDSLAIEGLDEEFDSYTVNYDNKTDGNVLFRDGQVVQSTLTFLGIDPLSIDGTPVEVILNLPKTNDVAVLSEVDANTMQLAGTTFETTTFSIAAATSLTINGGLGNDTIRVDSIASNYTGVLNIIGGLGSDQLIVDFAGGTNHYSGGINYDGTPGPADAIILRNTGAKFDSLTYRTTTRHTGNFTLINDSDIGGGDAFQTSSLVTFRNVGRTSLDGTATSELVFDLPATNDKVALSDTAAVGGQRFESVSGVMMPLDFNINGVQSLIVNGNNGHDTITIKSIDNTFAGTVELTGGDGNDVINAAGAKTIKPKTNVSPIVITPVNVLIYGGTGNDNLTGGIGNDTLLGEEGHDTLLGGDGNDSLNGGLDNDRIDGGNGNDTLLGDEGHDNLFGSNGNDLIAGGNGNDTINGGAGNDIMSGQAGNDSLKGGAGDDTLLGEDGNDYLEAEAGTDVVLAGDGNDTIRALSQDTISLGAGTNILIGTPKAIDESFIFDFDDLLV